MAEESSTQLKTYFETGDIPTETQFQNFIESYQNLVDNNFLNGIATAVTAYAGGGQANATALTNLFNKVTTCATNDDSVKLPIGVQNKVCYVYNYTANNLAIFPVTGEYIGGYGVNAKLTLPLYSFCKFFCSSDGYWQFEILTIAGVTTPKVYTVADAAALTPSTLYFDSFAITALAQALTINAPDWSVYNMQTFVLRINDNGTSRALTWDSVYRAVGVTLPTATTVNKVTYCVFVYNTVVGKWDCVNVVTQS